MTDPKRLASEEGLQANRRDLIKGVLFGGAVDADSRLGALKTAVLSGQVRSESTPSSSGSTESASAQRVATSSSPIPVRATENVSIRDIADGTNGVSGPSYRMSEVAEERGLLNLEHRTNPREDPPFAFRELITSQAIADTSISKRTKDRSSKWRNWVKDHLSSSLTEFRPEDDQDLLDAVIWSAREDLKVRAVGSGHSHSNVASPDRSFIRLSWNDSKKDLEGLIEPLRQQWVDPNISSDPDVDMVRVEAGATIKYLNRELLLDAGKALLNQGSFDGQTLAGAINTSTHGTGIQLGSLADAVRSVELVTVMASPAQPDRPVVRKFRIEPESVEPHHSDPLTDRERFEAAVGEHGTTLIQDDDVFHSVVVGYGCMGVAYSYTVDVRDRYFLHEDSITVKWSQFKDRLDTLAGPPDRWYSKPFIDVVGRDSPATGARHFQFRVNLAQVEKSGTNDSQDPRCLLVSHREPWQYDSIGGGGDEFDRWPSKPSWWDSEHPDKSWPRERRKMGFQKMFRNNRKRKKGGFHPKRTPTGVPPGINLRFKSAENNPSFVGKLPDLAPPADPPPSMTASYIALRRKRETQPHPEVDPNPPPPAISTEIAVPADQVVDAVEEVIEEVSDNEYAYNVPMGVRYVARGRHFLSPEYQASSTRNVPIAKVEVPFLVRAFKNPKMFGKNEYFSQQDMLKHGKNALGAVEKRLVQMSDRGDLDFARPHMGKTNNVNETQNGFDSLGDLYDRFDTWQGVHEQFNAFGTFNNAFTDDMGISQ